MTYRSNREAVEDVLASIREIIDMDKAQETSDNSPNNIIQLEQRATERAVERLVNPQSDTGALREEDIFNLTEMVTVTGDVVHLKNADDKVHARHNDASVQVKLCTDVSVQPSIKQESLLSSAAATETAAAFADLVTAHTSSRTSERAGITVEALAQEAMKPLLKEWLDGNLPQIVRQVVSEEIQKIRREI